MSSSAMWSSNPAPTRARPPRRQRVSGLSAVTGNSATTYLVIGFVVGLLVGLPVLGWWLWPVRTSNAVPSDLAQAYREAYVAMAADSYALSGDLGLAKARLGSWSPEESARIIASLQETAAASGGTVQTTRLQQLSADLGLLDGTAGAASIESTSSASTGGDAAVRPSGATFLMVLGGLLLAGGLVLGGYLVRRQGGLDKLAAAVRSLRTGGIKVPMPDMSTLRRPVERARQRAEAVTQAPAPTPTEMVGEECEATDDEASLEEVLVMLGEEVTIDEKDEVETEPDDAASYTAPRSVDDAGSLGVFMATYRHGSDEMFDTSYYLAEGSEFLGECGVGVAETTGDASPEQACAMELWLFDKGDIRTTTKLLVTDFALEDPDLREVLAGRGELVRTTPGQTVHLETACLRVQAEVVSVKYGDSPNAPARSYFQELTLELRVHRKD